jgi:DNA-binding GntR family transcriptional regulator
MNLPPAELTVESTAARNADLNAKAGAVRQGGEAAASVTAQDAAYAQLRALISIGRFLPGERLKIRQLSAELGLGQMPVRAALQRLAAEGAVANVPNAGVAIPFPSRAEFDDVLVVRLLIEGAAAERGASALTAADLAAMQALSDQMARALDAAQAQAYLEANEAWHLRLYRAAGSPTLLGLIETVWLKVGPLSNRLFDDVTALPVLNDGHEAAMAALARGDGTAVRQAVERDLVVAAQSLRRACRA